MRRDINKIKVGSWEQNVPTPPASKKKSTQKILSQIWKEQTSRYWKKRHKVKPEYLNARGKNKVWIDGTSIIQETALMD